MKIADRLIELARERKVLYTDLAAAAGIEPAAFMSIIDGKAEPTAEQLTKLADKLGTTAEDIKKPDAELFELAGVEIFRAGTWNGDKYTEQDLDDMVAAFADVGYRPPLKLGHKEASGAPAYGWVKAIRRVGDKLVADFMDLPQKVYDAVKGHRFDSVSSEIFWNIKRGAKVFRRALKAVALLGAEIPAVSGLKPLRDSFTLPPGIAAHAYTLTNEEMNMDKTVEQLQADLKAANDTIKELTEKGGNDEVIKTLKADNEAKEKRLTALETERKNQRIETAVKACTLPAYQPLLAALFTAASEQAEDKTYTVKVADKETKVSLFALAEQLRDQMNKDAAKLFRQIGSQLPEERKESDDNVSAEVDRKTKAYMDKHPDVKDYAVAMQLMLREPDNQDLAKQYASH